MTASLQNEANTPIDLVVIGAGIYGIQAARTYLELHPTDNVVVFESSEDIGGVWSSERVYDGFWTQTSLRILEFSDLPLKNVPESENFCDFFPAKYVASYLKTYVDSKVFKGQSLASRIVLHSTVDCITRIDAGWIISAKGPDGTARASSHLKTRKVINATGLTSFPNIPSLPGKEVYAGQILHSKNFAKFQKTNAYSKGCQRIIVVGGAKSAADIAYTCAKAGHMVTWIIRRSGAGPAAFVSAKGRGTYKNSNESFYTRFTSHFLVSYFFNESRTWLGHFLYKTWFGKKLIQKAWKSINTKVTASADYGRTDGKENGFYNLKPDTEIFWQNDSTGICQRPDFFDTIAHKVKVYREDIAQMTTKGLQLSSGTLVESETIVFATGWRPSHPKFRTEEGKSNMPLSLGISESAPQENLSSKSHWNRLESCAEKNVLARFPILHNRPPYHEQVSEQTTPLRLYKGVMPTGDDTIAFVGQLLLGNNFRVAEVQALYAIAALDGTLHTPTKQKMEGTIAETIAWDRLRYLQKGQCGNWAYWDMVPYTDNLLQELGLTSHRHKTYWKDLFAPCYASDLCNLIDEYKSKYRKL